MAHARLRQMLLQKMSPDQTLADTRQQTLDHATARASSDLFALYKQTLEHHAQHVCDENARGLAVAVLHSAMRRPGKSHDDAFTSLWASVHRKATKATQQSQQSTLQLMVLLAAVFQPTWVAQIVTAVQTLATKQTRVPADTSTMLTEWINARGCAEASAAQRLLAFCAVALDLTPKTPDTHCFARGDRRVACARRRNSVHSQLDGTTTLSEQYDRVPPLLQKAASTPDGLRYLQNHATDLCGDRYRDPWPPSHTTSTAARSPKQRHCTKWRARLRSDRAAPDTPPNTFCDRPIQPSCLVPPPVFSAPDHPIQLWNGINDTTEQKKTSWLHFCTFVNSPFPTK